MRRWVLVLAAVTASSMTVGCGTSGGGGGGKKDAGNGFIDILPFGTDTGTGDTTVAPPDVPAPPPDVPAPPPDVVEPPPDVPAPPPDVPEPPPDVPEPPPDVPAPPPDVPDDLGCVPQCAGKACGPDGCGGICGTCEAGTTCQSGACVSTVCTPFCQPGWECGPDGCDGSCGTCGAGEVCKNAKHVCEAAPPSSGAFGSACGRKGACQPTIPDPINGGVTQNPEWPTCVNAQCTSGYCLEPACTQECTIVMDSSDWQGNPVPDGIEDPESPAKSCAGAEDGPMGTTYTCVALTDGSMGPAFTLCLAGTTFKPCTANADCPPGESCSLQYILGEYSLRCSGAPKDPVGAGDYCNQNPDIGALQYCDSDLCLGLGCVDYCDVDAECATNAKGCGANGKCLDDPKVFCKVDTDCSAWKCKKDYKVYTDLDMTFDLCWPKTCGISKDCPDGDYYCATNFNGQMNAEGAWEHLCLPEPPGGATLGQACGDPTPICAENECLGGVCSALCLTDADCATAAVPMMCGWTEYTLDYDTDGTVDKLLPLGRCISFPGSQAPCKTDKDCGPLEACTYLETKVAGVYDAKTFCAAVGVDAGQEGDACGGDTGVTCASGLCLGGGNGQPGYCTKLCSSSADCGKGIALGTFTGTYDMVCYPILLGEGGTPGADADNVTITACAPLMPAGPGQLAILTDGSSLADCSADFSCPPGETCLGIGYGTGSTGPTSLEMLCVSQSDAGASPASLPAGSSCDPTSGSAYQCSSLLCLPDVALFSGYCSALCKADTDCPAGTACKPYVLFDRVDPTQDVTIPLCQK